MTRRSGLGRGLDALLPSHSDEGLQERGALQIVSPDAIDPNPQQPRDRFDAAELEDLARSIRELGILQPLLVREGKDGRYELIAGERRLRASKLAELDKVPVLVVETDDKGSLERALVENVHRSNLNPIEEAAAYRNLIDDGGLTQEALATRLGRGRVSITNSLRLLDLATGIQSLLVQGRLTAGHGKALLGLEGNPFQERLARRVADESLSVRETEDLVRRYQAMTGAAPKGGSGPGARPAEVTDAQRLLADHLQTRVRVELGKRKGKIVLDFVSLEELKRISDVMLGKSAGSTSRSVTPE